MSVVVVSNASQFAAAVASASARGAAAETIELQPGTYQNLSVSNYGGPGLTITSANASSPAVIEGMSVHSSANLTISGLDFSGANVTASPNYVSLLSVYDSSQTSVTNDQFDGPSTTTLAATAVKGAYFDLDSGVTFSGNTLSYLLDGVDNNQDNGVVETGNTFSHIFTDGIDTSATSNISITGNSFSTFHTDLSSTDHPDAIQFWTTGVASNSSNITVSNNTISRGAGSPIQGIFITSQNSYGYSNVTVSGNTVTGELGNGIWVDSASNIQVTNNTIQPFVDQVSRLILSSDFGGTVSGNKVGSALVNEGTSGVAISNNPLLAAIPVSSVASFVSASASLPPTSSSAPSSPSLESSVGSSTTALASATGSPHSTSAHSGVAL